MKFILTLHRTRNEKMLEENVAKLADAEHSSSSGGQSGYRHENPHLESPGRFHRMTQAVETA